jgi:hypothetical protein
MKFSGSRQANPTITTCHYSNFSLKRTHHTLFLSIAELANARATCRDYWPF